MPSWPVLLMSIALPLTGTLVMPAMKVRVWTWPKRIVLDSIAVPGLPR